MINKDAKFTAFFGIGVTVLASIICFIINAWAGAICLISGIILTGIYFYNIKKRNDKINELNNYLSLMCSGNFDLDIMDNSEGEMSILKNNLYKIMTLLKTQNEQLNTDKLYLANSLADISHQLKTPLTSMMVMSDLLKDEKDEGKRNEFLRELRQKFAAKGSSDETKRKIIRHRRRSGRSGADDDQSRSNHKSKRCHCRAGQTGGGFRRLSHRGRYL